jgi:hypothetical protein
LLSVRAMYQGAHAVSVAASIASLAGSSHTSGCRTSGPWPQQDPGIGHGGRYRWMYICDSSRSVGAGRATTRNTRGLTRSVIRLIVPPFPAVSRPSKTMQILAPDADEGGCPGTYADDGKIIRRG